MKSLGFMLALATMAAVLDGCFWVAVGGAGAEGGYVAAQDDRTSSEVFQDQLLFTKIKTALAAASRVNSGNIEVTVRKSVASLRGMVYTREEKAKALETVKGVQGVKIVVDKLYISR